MGTTWLMLEPEVRNLITYLKASRPSAMRPTYRPKILFFGDRSFNAAITLAHKLKFPHLVIEPKTIIDDNFINTLQRPGGSHSIIIKGLSSLLINNRFQEKQNQLFMALIQMTLNMRSRNLENHYANYNTHLPILFAVNQPFLNYRKKLENFLYKLRLLYHASLKLNPILMSSIIKYCGHL